MKYQRYLEPFAWLLKPFLGKAPIATFPPEFLGPNLVFQDTIKKDPLFYKAKMRLSTSLEMFKAGNKVARSPKKLQTPFMLFHGTADQIVSRIF